MYTITCFVKWLQKDQRVHHIWGLIQLHCGLNAGKVTCSNSKGVVTVMGCMGLWYDCLHVGCIAHSHRSPSASEWPCLATRTSHATNVMFSVDLDVHHLSDIHSWQLPCEAWGPQIAKLPQVCQWACGSSKGLLDRVITTFTV